MRPTIAQVALPVPLDKRFDYLIKPEQFPVTGGRVTVPFGRQTLVGIVTAMVQQSDLPNGQLKAIKEVLDIEPVWPEPLYELLNWCSQFYQHPLGDTLSNALPTALKKGKAAQFASIVEWRITEAGKNRLMSGFGRAFKQAKVMHMLESGPVPHQVMLDEEIPRSVLNTLNEKGWIDSLEKKPTISSWPDQIENIDDKPRLNEEQAVAIATVNSNPGFGCYLLEGVTGSGKTEVYLNLIKPVLDKGKQALILVPEIGLTPQTINRFKKRFNLAVEVIHSGLNETERLNAWLGAKNRHYYMST